MMVVAVVVGSGDLNVNQLPADKDFSFFFFLISVLVGVVGRSLLAG
uniref:Uncharacterized protein n=1 Tax=Rhizophora mucronata TaxID=61149 RepID=A0A2P2KKG9_RHIMU